MSDDEFSRLSKALDIDAAAPNRPMLPVDMASDQVTAMVKANARVILGTKRLGKDRIRDSRNALSESAYTHFELVSMLAVAIDRLAVFEALTPTPNIDQISRVLRKEIEQRMPKAVAFIGDNDYDKIARAVLDR